MSAAGKSTAGRFDDLEARVAFQEHELEQLGEVVAAQRRELEILRRQLEVLGQRTRDLAARLPDDTGDAEPPPHY